MPITTFNVTGTIVMRMAANSNTIVPIFQANLKADASKVNTANIVATSSFIKNLKAKAEITSIQRATLPSFNFEDSETDKLYKTLDIEWKSARKQLDLFIRTNSTSTWEHVYAFSLLNPAGYPFRLYNLMDAFTDNLAVELGANSEIGVSVKDVGYGLLTAQDSVVIHGNWVQEIVYREP